MTEHDGEQRDEQQELAAAHKRLRRAVTQLVEPRQRTVRRDDGGRTTGMEPSLVALLISERGHGGDTGVSKGGGGAAVPIAVAVVDLLNEIERGERELSEFAGARLPDSTSFRNRMWAAANCLAFCTDLQSVEWAADLVAGWVARGRAILDPVRRMDITAPCPACGESWVALDDAGELVGAPALTADGIRGAHCRACAHAWPTAALVMLALEMGLPVPDGVLGHADPSELDKAG